MSQQEFDFMKDIQQDYELLAKGIGALLNEKQAAYGDSFGKLPEIIEVLYPDGIATHQYKNFLTLVRIMDKVFRIASMPENQKDLMGEEPWKDIAGYAILALNKE